ncbi:MAG TPA: (d)CMP kinase [Candidatus Limnocylindrales bacterium]|jgi:cytidylate kinase
MAAPAKATRSRTRARKPPVERRVVVALDGPASSGKSSVGAAAAGRLGLRFVDTGLLYRALTAAALREGITTDDAPGLVALADRVTLGDDGTGRLTTVLLDGVDTTTAARGPDVDAAVSAVSRIAEVRAALLPRQRALAEGGGIVVAGRDIGTVVLPDADLKLFLDATVEERAARRIDERALDPAGEEAEAVRAQLRDRDAQDRNRAVAPLRAADDAVIIETDGNTFERTVDIVEGAIRTVESALAPLAPAVSADPVDASEPAAEATPAPAPAPGPAPERRPNPEPAKPRSGNLERAMRLDNGQTMLVRMVALCSRIGARAFANVRIEGLENIPRAGALILALNHVSNADSFVTGSWITPALKQRRIHWLGKKELFDWPGFGWLAARGGVHPVDRDSADIEAFRLATRILEAGYVLLIFPEGTRSPNGELQEAKDGLAMLALRTGAVIVPIGINDSDRVWPRGSKIPLPIPRRTVTVRVGTPFHVADLVPAGSDRRTAKAIATKAIMGRIAALLDPRQRGVYADAVPSAIAPSDLVAKT